jgi:hypothetical protein
MNDYKVESITLKESFIVSKEEIAHRFTVRFQGEPTVDVVMIIKGKKEKTIGFGYDFSKTILPEGVTKQFLMKKIGRTGVFKGKNSFIFEVLNLLSLFEQGKVKKIPFSSFSFTHKEIINTYVVSFTHRKTKLCFDVKDSHVINADLSAEIRDRAHKYITTLVVDECYLRNFYPLFYELSTWLDKRSL